MGLNTKIDKQIDNYYEIVSINKSLSEQKFYLKVLVLILLIFFCISGYEIFPLFLIFNVIVVGERFI